MVNKKVIALVCLMSGMVGCYGQGSGDSDTSIIFSSIGINNFNQENLRKKTFFCNY